MSKHALVEGEAAPIERSSKKLKTNRVESRAELTDDDRIERKKANGKKDKKRDREGKREGHDKKDRKEKKDKKHKSKP